MKKTGLILFFVGVLGGCSSDDQTPTSIYRSTDSAVGPQGPKGDPGAVGPAGPQGPIGPAGPAGPAGPQGIPGTGTGTAAAKGDKGDPGTPGAPGVAGPIGPAGPAGPQGIPGTAAAKGDKGDQGPKGDKGDKGDPGTPGTPGAASGASMYVSGTRIRAKFFNTADGAHGFAGWYDTSIQTLCSPQVAADGVTRCLPTGQLPLVDQTGNAYFQTSACSGAPIVAVNTGTPPTKYATGYSMTFPSTIQVREVGAEFMFNEFVTGLYYGNPSRGCVFMELTAAGGRTYYRTGDLVAFSTFVTMTESIE